MSKKKQKTVKTKEELLEKYNELKRNKNNWWNVLAHENNSIKTIVGGFILYIGYIIIASINVDVLTLLYTVTVVGVIWYWVDMLRTQYETQNKEYKQQMRILSGEIRKWSKKKIVAENPKLHLAEKRQFHIVQTLLPYIWGFSPESLQQFDHFEYGKVSISSVEIKQEKEAKEYWFLAASTPLKFGEEGTMILPKPYQHDKWQKIAFNKAIELPKFKEDFGIFSSEFMQAYYLISRPLIETFLSLPTADKWLVFRKNSAYLLLPKNTINYSIEELDKLQETASKEAQEGIGLAESFEKLLAA